MSIVDIYTLSCPEKVAQLLKDPNTNVNEKNSSKSTPLMNACLFDFVETVKILLSHKDVNVNHVNKDGYAALHNSTVRSPATTQLLLEREELDVTVGHGLLSGTPLHCAVSRKDLNSTKTIIDRYHGKDVRDKKGRTPLMDAVINGSVEIVEYMLPLSRMFIDAKDKCGMTAFDYAVKSKNDTIIKLFG